MTIRQGPARGAVAGFVAAGLGTGFAEFAAAVWPASPSPVETVATAVIDRAPLAAVERAIRVFGTRDKVALVTLTGSPSPCATAFPPASSSPGSMAMSRPRSGWPISS